MRKVIGFCQNTRYNTTYIRIDAENSLRLNLDKSLLCEEFYFTWRRRLELYEIKPDLLNAVLYLRIL
jgi:hypothetical protein